MLPCFGGPRHADLSGKIRSGWPLVLLAISISSARLAFGSRGLLSGSVSMLAHQNRRSKREMQISSTNKGPNRCPSEIRKRKETLHFTKSHHRGAPSGHCGAHVATCGQIVTCNFPRKNVGRATLASHGDSIVLSAADFWLAWCAIWLPCDARAANMFSLWPANASCCLCFPFRSLRL